VQAVSSEKRRFSRTSKLRRPVAKSFGSALQGQGSRGPVERRRGSVHTGLKSVEEVIPGRSRVGVDLYSVQGVSQSSGSCVKAFGRWRMFRALRSGRVREPEAWEEKALERQKLKRGSTTDPGQLSSV
jgi:hypothetical protein